MKKLIVLIIFVLLFGCSKPPLFDTQVLDKQYEPANTFIMLMPMIVGKTTIMIPYVIHDDEDFVLNVMGYTDKGERLCRRIYVSSEQYNAVGIGDAVDHLTMQYTDEHGKRAQ